MKLLLIASRFFLAGLAGAILTGVFLPPSAWVIGLILEGDQLHVANTGSAYYFLSLIFLYYAVPISFAVSAISAVVGRTGCGAWLGVAGTVVFATFLGRMSMSGFGLMANGAVAAALIGCGIGASRFRRRRCAM